ncbi:protein hupE [Marinomonas ushuaiensis DSM 15871]|uniref:Protein hupE n=1 Tax=Marinomonas ushuaiensis DSM 15871 TaxID=1122207 RepID=X7E455_9GAMM|nr:HupE/UreJ family protein [Marinomonas ushuaiensis]ETX10665.1 protein hupE [Marinomonas ushuaiensis DSM 15871]
MRLNTLKMGLVALIATIPTLAFAHPGHEHASGFMTGFMHPMLGLDHLLAMLAVGLWGASLGGRALWAVPTAFVATMLFGGGLVLSSIHVPFIEQGITLSVIMIGMLLVSATRLPVVASASIAGLFALFHGAAHGVEIPLHTSGIEYGLGFATATLALHVVGLGFGTAMVRLQTPILTRATGSAIALAGIFLAVA